MKTTLRISVRDDISIKEIQFQTPSPLGKTDTQGYYATTAHGPDLMENSKNAARYLIDWLEKEKGLTRSQAYVLCSAAADLKISEIVDVPNFIVSAYMPLGIFSS
jgi:acetamidase/formamidase